MSLLVQCIFVFKMIKDNLILMIYELNCLKTQISILPHKNKMLYKV